MSGGPAITVIGQLADVPPIRYARNGDVHLAYQQFGEGPDLVAIPPIAQNIEVAWEHPRYRKLFAGLSSFSRFLHFDKRGTGMSDRDAGVPSLDERVDDLRAILDCAGVESAFLCGVSEGGPIAIVFAATYPERVRGVALYGAVAGRREPSPDELETDQLSEQAVEAWMSAWGTDQTLSPAAFTPSLADDADYVRWLSRYERQSASPGDLRRLVALSREIDVGAILPYVRVPTLVLHRKDDRAAPVANAHYLAERLPNAELVLLDGSDHAPHAGDIDGLVAELRRFVLGPSAGPGEADRMLATVMFTDIVRSTERLAEVGDRRWREVLDVYDGVAEALVVGHGGRVVKSTGDGLLAVFDGPARAVTCARRLGDAVAGLGIEQRTGVHAGEVERRGDDIGGIAVHIAARVQSLAQPGEILVTRTVRDLVVGSDLGFQPRGVHPLKGLPEPWELLAVAR